MKMKDLSKLYGVLLLLHLSSLHVGEHSWLIILSKGSLLFVLGVWFYDQSRWKGQWALYFGVAQLLSWIGDLLLEVEGLFLFGLGTFLLAQLAYLRTFWTWIKGLEKSTVKWLLASIAPSILFVFLVVPRAAAAGGLKIPILVYAIVLSLVWTASLRLVLANKTAYGFLALGSTVFLISDALLAFNLFLGELPHASIFIMFTYGLAQYLYTYSASKELQKG